MLRSRRLAVLAAFLFLGVGASRAQTNAGPALRIDIPTKPDKGNVVVDFGHLVLNGDMPFALGDIHMLASDFHDWNTQGQIVVIFHGDAAYLVLNDQSYDEHRHASSGNPYKALLNILMQKGVQLEPCGATAKGNHWGNENL